MKFNFIGPSYTSRSLAMDGQQSLNLYPEINESGGGKNKIALIGTPGLSTFGAVTSGPVRGMFYSDEAGGRLLVAGNNALYDVDSLGSETALGSIASATNNPISVAFNGTEYLIIADNTGYILNGTTLTAISDADFTALTPVMARFLDSYFIIFDKDTQVIYISGSYAGTDWNPLEFASAESSPDDLVSIFDNNETLWMFGAEKTEVFTNTGNLDFPFERIQGATIEEGNAAERSVAKFGGGLAWLAGTHRGDGKVVLARGMQPQRISNHAIEFAINSYSDISDATAYAYSEEGHEFYVLNFPTGEATWVYDLITNMWHERSYWNSTIGRHQDVLGQSHVFGYGKHLVGDRRNGNIYTQSLDTFADSGDAIIRRRRSPHISNEDQWLFHHHLHVDMESGVGLDGAGQGSDPKAMMRFSDDGGHNWSSEKQGSLGKIGVYGNRLKWNRLGRSRDRVYEVSISDPVKVVLVEGYISATAGGNG
jgi:hypothetical protein